MDKTLQSKIQSYFKEHQTISKNDLVESILKDFPYLKDSSISVYLSQLKKKGVIKNPARGVYALIGKEEFSPIVDVKLKRLFKRIKKDYPFIEFCIWSTSWLNELMRHQPFKYYTVLELEKHVAESVFYSLKEQRKQVFFEPNNETFELYIHNSNDVIIIKQLKSEAPLQEIGSVVVPCLEKLLVDMIIDTKVYAAQQGELDFIYFSAFKKFEINRSKMKRYALRRNKEKEIGNLINMTLANI